MFTPQGKAFRVFYRCAGTGEILLYRAGKESVRYPCDGVSAITEFLVPPGPQRISVGVTGTSEWLVAIVDGAQFTQTASPTPDR